LYVRRDRIDMIDPTHPNSMVIWHAANTEKNSRFAPRLRPPGIGRRNRLGRRTLRRRQCQDRRSGRGHNRMWADTFPAPSAGAEPPNSTINSRVTSCRENRCSDFWASPASVATPTWFSTATTAT